MKKEDIDELEVRIISIETIKPLTPTPSHLKTYTLSLVDQIHPPYYSTMLLFYPNTIETRPGGIDIVGLKSSLSETLSKFYLFAGRCNDDFTVSCNDQGIPFIETRVDCRLYDFLTSSNKLDNMNKLTPPQEFMTDKPMSERVPLVFQVNVFSCGGVVIGCFKFHKLLLDGTSLVGFLKHWAAVTASEHDPVVAPDFDAVLSAFPPCRTLDWQPFDFNCPEYQAMIQQCKSVRVVAKSFVFTKQALSELKAKAASKEVPKPTRTEALAGFIWEHCLAAAHATGAMPMGPDPSVMSILVNMRPRLNPPLANASMGNLITTATARAKKGMGQMELVREIHTAITNVSERIDSYKEGQNIEGLVGDIGPINWYNKAGMYVVSSWCQFGMDEIDFGFGKPKWASPSNGVESLTSRNDIYFVVDSSGDGIEVWIYLEEVEMQILERNEQFRTYTFPDSISLREDDFI
ncbi:stemmadenine O-acetyltransferase-like [Silene latifolia]|uniref:stemmadenine O-acetyltransferase-like n=1 Tax=Silene latifolia TaxID=37657 RepID=UPI003D787B2D